MSTALDMSLDDLIKNNKKSARGGGASGSSRGRGGGGGSRGAGGPSRRFPNRSASRSTPYSTSKPVQGRDSALMAVDQMKGGRSSGLETGTKLYISNLDYGVSNDDIKELFSELGDLKRYSINYDRSGRSKGTAEVVFSRKADALLAVKKYNNVQLDGKPMKIEIVAPVVPAITNGIFGNSNVANKSGQGRGGAARRPRGGGSRGRGSGRGCGRGRGRNEPISAEALDADLEKYHTEAMQIN